jgi:hypothetical protein
MVCIINENLKKVLPPAKVKKLYQVEKPIQAAVAAGAEPEEAGGTPAGYQGSRRTGRFSRDRAMTGGRPGHADTVTLPQ